MRPRRLTWLTLLLVPVLLAGCSVGKDAELRLDGSSVWSTVEVKRGTRIKIDLDANPTTGYEWEVLEIDEQFLRLDGSTYKADNAGAIGGGGTETFTFSSLEAGLTVLQLIYKRPNDAPTAADQTYRVTMNIID